MKFLRSFDQKHALALFVSTTIFFSACKKTSEGDTSHWDYEHAKDWSATGYPECAGTIQSPVDIDVAKTVTATGLPVLVFNYNNFNPKLIDNTHTLQVNNNGTNTIVFQSKTYNFLQFHIHAHSEHTINGATTPMEIHLVHSDPGSGALLVVGVWINSGTANALMDKVLNNWPTAKETEVTSTESINLTDLLPSNKNYYTYVGSLTTPPCTQGVTFVLLKQAMTMSTAQITKFTNVYDHNWRPTQPLNNRIVYSSN